MPNFGAKYALLGYFWAGTFKIIVTFEIRTLEFVKNKFLTHTVNSALGSVFSKVLGSAISDVLGPGPGPLYKVCN